MLTVITYTHDPGGHDPGGWKPEFLCDPGTGISPLNSKDPGVGWIIA